MNFAPVVLARRIAHRAAAIGIVLRLVMATLAGGEVAPLVANGSFEERDPRTGGPLHWAAAGASGIQQQLTTDIGRDGHRCAKLECTAFAGDGPSAHAMIAQSGRIAARSGRWYRLTCWARGEQIKAGAVEVALSNTRPWGNTGLADAFTPGREWQRFEFLFRCTQDVAAASSRLQFWFKSTGTLWLDDVELTESTEGQQWLPQIATDGVKNFVPNSSFECGGANWGSFSYGIRGWMGNLYRLEGDVDTTASPHGGHCLKIALSPETTPTFWFDYYEPIRQPIRRVLAANRGWFRVQPGEKLTLSVEMRADADGVVAQLAAVEPGNRVQRKAVTVGREWQRHEFTFVPRERFIFIAAGLDLEESKRDAAVLWLDAIQLERGEHATAYEPRRLIEAFVETAVPGNIFTRPDAGAQFSVRAYNASAREQTASGRLTLTDFFDQRVYDEPVSVKLAPRSGANVAVRNVLGNRRGYFRANWAAADGEQSLRCAIIDPIPPGTKDSPLGFNHAYPWQFLVRLARQAGIVWWRDWSAQWETIERAPGKFTWAEPDAQIDRVLQLDSQVDVLIPFPSAQWSSNAPADVMREAATGRYPESRLPVAFAPKQPDEFGRFAADVVRHYHAARPQPLHTYQILNESVYTSYSLPQKYGYKVEDYVRLLRGAYSAMKAADPTCRVVAGCGNTPTSTATREFLEQGGAQYCDVVDVHMYAPPVPAETYAEPFARLEQLMRAHGGVKPIWMTEWGCYADDDPPCVPHIVGDASMNRSKWPSELAATEHIVKFVAVTFGHGMRKLFFHAGTCGAINGPDAGGVLFEYGGAPRKMYAGVAALTRLLGTPVETTGCVETAATRAYAFRNAAGGVVVAWSNAASSPQVKLTPAVRAYDIMGNELPTSGLVLRPSPFYIVGSVADTQALLTGLGR